MPPVNRNEEHKKPNPEQRRVVDPRAIGLPVAQYTRAEMIKFKDGLYRVIQKIINKMETKFNVILQKKLKKLMIKRIFSLQWKQELDSVYQEN